MTVAENVVCNVWFPFPFGYKINHSLSSSKKVMSSSPEINLFLTDRSATGLQYLMKPLKSHLKMDW
jgi:hypothetical protein